ncbi:MAG: TatD family hydrolase, partial [Verrucomicrobiota bacterium]
REVREAALLQGVDRLMLETDSPFLTPMPHRGKPNEPAFLSHTARFAAELFEMTEQELAARSSARVSAFYGLD